MRQNRRPGPRHRSGIKINHKSYRSRKEVAAKTRGEADRLRLDLAPHKLLTTGILPTFLYYGYRPMSLRLLPSKRFLLTFALAGTVPWAVGCGSSSAPQASATASPAATANNAMPSETELNRAATVVAQFLDAVRRGGETGGANQMLTSDAQAVLQQLGRSVEPIGSTDAVFKVTRAEPVPDTPEAALVHSFWTEPKPDGKSETYQVVWAVEREASGWKISGLAMDMGQEQEPMIVDFENSQQMAMLFNDKPAVATNAVQGSGEASQAAAPTDGIQR